jgi:hypothetical protein
MCDDITQDSTPLSDDITLNNTNFNAEEVDILKKIINDYKSAQLINEIEIEDDEILTRSVRVYKNHFERFAKYCRDNNINQAKAMAKAIDLLIDLSF